MRPVNLIPPEERRGEQAPLRTGPTVYILVGALVTVLVAVAAMVLVDNQISERESEITRLEVENQVAAEKAAELASYTQFQMMSEARAETVRSLADSRFDWERVMRELSLILPADVTLTAFDATAGGGGSAESGMTGSGGPMLSLSGCATGQEGVAGFVTALKDIDGVTRVGVESSALGGSADEGAGSTTEVGAAPSDSSTGCEAGDSVATFSMQVAFDAAPVASEGEASSVGTEEVTSEAETEEEG